MKDSLYYREEIFRRSNSFPWLDYVNVFKKKSINLTIFIDTYFFKLIYNAKNNTFFMTIDLQEKNELYYINKESLLEETFLRDSENYKRDVLKGYKQPDKLDFIKVYSSTEYIPYHKCLELKRLLSYIKYKYSTTLEESLASRLDRNYKTLSYLLNSMEDEGIDFTSMNGNLHILRKCNYGYVKSNTHGRIFPEISSIT